LNINELRLMTGPAGADAVLVGVVADDSLERLQPARLPTVMSNEPAPMRSLRRTDWFLSLSTPAIRHGGIHGWVLFQSCFPWTTNVRFREEWTNP
jgi:hypothetical protein